MAERGELDETDRNEISATRRRLLQVAGVVGGAMAMGGTAVGGPGTVQASTTGDATGTTADSGGALDSAGFLNVADTDAVGDGTTDDAPAIQDAISRIPPGEQRVLLFEAGTHYYLGSTLTVPLQTVRGVAGNGAFLKVDGDYPALQTVGSFTTTASPEAGTNKALARSEFGASVGDLTVYAPEEAYVGTGLHAVGTFGLDVSNCVFTGLGTGVSFAGRNRDATLSNNLVWDNREYGLHLDGGSFHQFNVTGNHVAYSRKGVYAENAHLANLQFVGNDVETSPSADGGEDALLHFEAGSDGGFVESVVANNTIQGHGSVDACLKVGNRNCHEIIVANNVVRNASGPLLSFDACSYLVVEGNTLVNGKTGVKLARYGGHLVVDGNLANQVDRFLDVYLYGDLLPTSVTNNVVRCRGGKAVGIHSDGDVTDLTVTGNRVHSTAEGLTADRALVEADAAGTLEGALVADNRVDLGGNACAGLRVSAADYNGVIVRDNVVRGSAGSATPCDLPVDRSGRVVVKDNLAVE